MSKRIKALIPLVLGAAFLAYLVVSSMQLSPVTCEVTMDFRGRTETRQASGQTTDEATMTATNNACALIANGRDESILCGQTPPASVECEES